MKLFIVLALALAVAKASAFDLRENEIEPRNVEVPVKVPEGRIINGNDAAPGQFPYQVGLSLFVKRSKGMCGGSLINNEWVLTAAHCTDGIKKVVVILGATNRKAAEVKYTVYSDDIIIHPEWNPTTLKNDISLIKIPTTSYSSMIRPVKLPSIAKSYSSYAGDYAIASGWGRTSDHDKTSITTLQYAELDIVNNRACTRIYRKIFQESNICVATPGGVSTCHGDSGGPLVLASTGVQVGLTSYGPSEGCEKGFPVVFTRVTSYLDWIKECTGISY